MARYSQLRQRPSSDPPSGTRVSRPMKKVAVEVSSARPKRARKVTRAGPKATSNPAARVYKGDMEQFGKASEFPYAATTYRLTEHQHFWTKHARSNAVVQPAPFVEIGEELAKEKGIKNGDMVKVKSNRGEVKAACVVTKRIRGLDVNGKKVHTVGIPIHWGFKGVTQNGYLANALTPFVGDANSQTPEFNAFLVNLEKA